jgi:hypothetical protein
LTDDNVSCVVVIRAWMQGDAFRARMIVQSDPNSLEDVDERPAQVVVTDSIDMLCTALRTLLVERSP